MRGLVVCFVVFVGLPAGALAQWVVVDNTSPQFRVLSGAWSSSTGAAGYWGTNFLVRQATSAGVGVGEVEWRPTLPSAGTYEVSVIYTGGSNRADNSPFTVYYQGGSILHPVNQQIGGGEWLVLGTYPFAAGTDGYVRLSNDADPTYVVADAVRFRDVTNVVAISPDDPRIEFGGLFFAEVAADSVYLNRFSDEVLASSGGLFNPAWAQTTSGVIVRFRTDSTWVTALFRQVPSENRGNQFGVYQDGIWDSPAGGLEVCAASRNLGQPVTYEIVCPSWSNVAFAGLQIEQGASLLPLGAQCRPRYVAFGDSITHGTGQGSSSYLTYPWILAQAKGWDLFNLGVGGSKTTPAFGAMLDAERLDVVTVLWGFNDWNRVNDMPRFTANYQAFLDNLRLQHPVVPIYCITLIATATSTPSVDHGYSCEDYRQAIRDIVSSRAVAGDANIHVIEGAALTSTSDLSSDGIHLSVSGAANFATRLNDAIGYAGPGRSRGDFDSDCDVDLSDFSVFQGCFNGPNRPSAQPNCGASDLDGDADVDLSDFAVFQGCFNGPNRPAACP